MKYPLTCFLAILAGSALGWMARQMHENARQPASELHIHHIPARLIIPAPAPLQRPSVQLRPVRPAMDLPAAAPVEKSGESIRFEF